MLTIEGQGALAAAIGEILGNAEEHAGSDVKWTVLGCFDKTKKTVSFAVINAGQTIFESLSNESSTSREVLLKVEEIVQSHRGFLDKLGDQFKPDTIVEPIWNVMALQEGISSKRTETGEASTRGQGMMDVLEFLKELKSKQDDGRLVVISGHSHILVDFTYPMRDVKIGAEYRRQIIFNKEQDLHLPQDSNKVKYLKNKFQGTIIAGHFILNDNYVRPTWQ